MAETMMQAWTTASGEIKSTCAPIAQEALEQYRGIGDRVGEARALLDCATSAIWISQWARARAAIWLPRKFSRPSATGRACTRHGKSRIFAPSLRRFRKARRLFALAREHYERVGDRRVRAASLINEGSAAVWQGRARDAKSLAQAALDLAREIDHTALRAEALANLGSAERDLGELDAALFHMDHALTLRRQLGVLTADSIDSLADFALARAMHGELLVAVDLAEDILTSTGRV